jgi:PTS system mannose-specific IIA component
MIGILILAQEAIGAGLVDSATHILGRRPPRLEVLAVDDAHCSPEELTAQIRGALTRLDEGDGTLILADIFGASHTNTACHLVTKGRVELVSGVNLPMLVRVLNHRSLRLAQLVGKATSGGSEGIVCASERLKSEK